MPEYFCFPVCVKCVDSGTCIKMMPKMESVDPGEYIRTRAVRNFNIPSAYLPCGCFGLPWPIVACFGENIEDVLCETHGWVPIQKGYKFSSKPPKPKRKSSKKGAANGAGIPFLRT